MFLINTTKTHSHHIMVLLPPSYCQLHRVVCCDITGFTKHKPLNGLIEKNIPARDPKQCGEAKGYCTIGGDDLDDGKIHDEDEVDEDEEEDDDDDDDDDDGDGDDDVMRWMFRTRRKKKMMMMIMMKLVMVMMM